MRLQPLQLRSSTLLRLLNMDTAWLAFPLTEKRSDGMVALHMSRWVPALANGIEFTHLGAAPRLARLLIVFALAHLLLQAGSFQKFLEAPQSGAKGFPVMDAHPQGHRLLR